MTSPGNGPIHAPARKPNECADGASLVGLLLVVLVLGVLMVSTVIGVQSMTGSSGSDTRVLANAAATGNVANRTRDVASGNVAAVPQTVACKFAADAARSASTLYFANLGGTSYPVKWSDLTTANPPIYKLAANVMINATNAQELDGPGWKLFMSGGGASPTRFTCV